MLQDDLLELLGKAVTCAILGKSGQQRSRVLALLVKVRILYLLYESCRIFDQMSSFTAHLALYMT